MADRPAASGEGHSGTSNHVPPLPGRRGAAPSTPYPKSSEPPPNDWRPSSTTDPRLLSDFTYKRVFRLLTGLLFLILCVAMPSLAFHLLTAWDEHRSRPAQTPTWSHGACPPHHHLSVDMLPWWTTAGPPVVIRTLRVMDGQLWVLLQHRSTRLATCTQAALSAGLAAVMIPWG